MLIHGLTPRCCDQRYRSPQTQLGDYYVPDASGSGLCNLYVTVTSEQGTQDVPQGLYPCPPGVGAPAPAPLPVQLAPKPMPAPGGGLVTAAPVSRATPGAPGGLVSVTGQGAPGGALPGDVSIDTSGLTAESGPVSPLAPGGGAGAPSGTSFPWLTLLLLGVAALGGGG